MKRLAFLAVALAFTAHAMEVRAESDWVNVSDNLIESLEAYDDSIPGARGVGGVAVDRHTGDVIMALNGPPFGLYRSRDAGNTWERIDGGSVAGGWVRSFSIRVDQDRPGRMAAFRVLPPAPKVEGRGRSDYKALDAMTLDGGKTWSAIETKSSFHGLGGWELGMVDWTPDEPTDMIAHIHGRGGIFFSRDSGQKWENIPGWRGGISWPSYTMDYIEAKDPNTWRRLARTMANGFGIADGAVLLGKLDGIERIQLDEEDTEPAKVSDFVVSAHTPVAFGGKLYWGAEKGVLVSPDGGRTWELLGAELPMVRKGPMFGPDADNMVVVTEDAVYRTRDGCRTWAKISDPKVVEDAWRSDARPSWLRTDYAWDHTRGLLYVAGLAGAAYKKEIR